MKINKMLQTINSSSRYGASKKYIVIHYVGAVSSARNNCIYFARGYRAASAHFFVDDEIWQSVALSRAAWHCGGGYQDYGTRYGGGSYMGKCTNSNSIGIEMCVYKKKGKYRVTDKTVENTAKLVQWLMKKYDIPTSRVIRHWDVTGKSCPYVYWNGGSLLEADTWKKFKAKLTGTSATKKTTKKTTTTKTTKKKTNQEIAKEVIAGKWGNGNERKKKLAAAGYDYSAIQKIVNLLLK